MAISRHMLRSSPLILLPLLLLLPAAIVMLFFCLLAGATNHNPLNRTWFLQADTSGIPNAPPLTHFTMYNACGDLNGISVNCGPRIAAMPMLPQTYFDTSTNVPTPFLGSPSKYFYLSRFSYAFYIISIFWILLAMLAALGGLFSTMLTGVAAALSAIALLSTAFLAAIMTSVYVMAQNAFRDAGRFARVGVKAFAFTWTSLTLIFLSFLSLAVAYLYRRRAAKKARYPTPRKEGMVPPERHREGDFEARDKRESYSSSYYTDRNHEKDIDAGRPSTAKTGGVTYGDAGNPYADEGEGRYGGRGPAGYETRGGGVGSLADAQKEATQQQQQRGAEPVRNEEVHLNAPPTAPAGVLKKRG